MNKQSLREIYGILRLVEVMSGYQWDEGAGFCLVIGLFQCFEPRITGPSAGTNSFVTH